MSLNENDNNRRRASHYALKGKIAFISKNTIPQRNCKVPEAPKIHITNQLKHVPTEFIAVCWESIEV